MSDTTTTPPVDAGISAGWKISVAIIVLLNCGGTIWWLMLKGASENLLHQNAMSWAWISIIVVVAGIGLGAVVHLIPTLRATK